MKKLCISIILIITSINLYGYQLDFDTNNLKIKSNKNGIIKYINANGTIITKYKDRVVGILKSKTIITKWKNGKKNIKTYDGVYIDINIDGSTKYKFPNGKIIETNFNGLTPYGLKIKNEKRTFKRKRFYVTIEYSSIMSDNFMNRYVKRFYNQVKKDVYNWLYIKNRKDRKIKLVFSFCKFNKTGYCKRQNRKNLKIFLVENGKAIDSLIFSESEIINSKLLFFNTNKVIDKLLNSRY